MKKAILLFVFLFIFGMAASGSAAVFNVSTPAGFQTALTTAESNGEDDTINVAAGTYDVSGGTLTYLPAAGENYSLTIQGAGAGATILDGGGSVQILNIDTSGLADDSSANIIIRDMTFQNGNNSAGTGGGLYVLTSYADIIVEDSEFIGNSAAGGGGGAAADSDTGTVTLTNNTFTDNLAVNVGGALANSDTGTVILTNNTFTGNFAVFVYGGAFADSDTGTVTLTNNTFTGNSAGLGVGGAGAGSDTGTVTLTNNTFTGNVAGVGGGAFAGSDTGTVTLTNNTFTGNSAVGGDAGGATAYSDTGTVTLTNNTFTGNSAVDSTGGLAVVLGPNSAAANIYNNIIWGNTAATGGDLYVFDDFDADGTGATVNLYNNDFSDFVIDDGDNLSQGGNIDQDPLLTPDLHLQAGSPCIDVGDNGAPSLPATDFDGEARIMNGTVDMGADEYTVIASTAVPVPTMNEWGMIIFMLLAGLGAVRRIAQRQ